MNRINLICLGVSDMRRALEFYKKIGFCTFEKDDNPPIVFFNNQGAKLELYPVDKLAKDINADNPPPLIGGGFYGITLAINMKTERDVDAFMETVVTHGGAIAKSPERAFWGGYSGYFQDPDGHYWEVAYGPDWKFDENDMLIIEEGG